MKKLFFALLVLVAASSYAQSTQDVELLQAQFGKSKQALVKEYMELSKAQDSVFWSLYDDYEKERQQLVRERLKNLNDYVSKYQNLNDESAQKVMNSILSNDTKLINLESKYLAKMSKAIGGMKAASFFQLENYFRNLIFSKIQEEMPAIGSLKK